LGRSQTGVGLQGNTGRFPRSAPRGRPGSRRGAGMNQLGVAVAGNVFLGFWGIFTF
jgi:hypothetical protein